MADRRVDSESDGGSRRNVDAIDDTLELGLLCCRADVETDDPVAKLFESRRVARVLPRDGAGSVAGAGGAGDRIGYLSSSAFSFSVGNEH